MEYCIINCTVQTKQDAIEIAKELVNKKLIGCCNIIPDITSVYSWNNELNIDDEVLMIMKTKLSLYPAVEAEIKKLHKYEVPEIICTPLTCGNTDYMNWIENVTAFSIND